VRGVSVKLDHHRRMREVIEVGEVAEEDARILRGLYPGSLAGVPLSGRLHRGGANGFIAS
jgi:hypothetical protein